MKSERSVAGEYGGDDVDGGGPIVGEGDVWSGARLGDRTTEAAMASVLSVIYKDFRVMVSSGCGLDGSPS